MNPDTMATLPKPGGNNDKQAIEDALSMSRQGKRQVMEFHQHCNDPVTLHHYLELLGIFMSLEETIKSINIRNERMIYRAGIEYGEDDR